MTRETWELLMQREAREKGYSLSFVGTDNSKQVTALFFNGPFFCYSRPYKKEGE